MIIFKNYNGFTVYHCIYVLKQKLDEGMGPMNPRQPLRIIGTLRNEDGNAKDDGSEKEHYRFAL